MAQFVTFHTQCLSLFTRKFRVRQKDVFGCCCCWFFFGTSHISDVIKSTVARNHGTRQCCVCNNNKPGVLYIFLSFSFLLHFMIFFFFSFFILRTLKTGKSRRQVPIVKHDEIPVCEIDFCAPVDSGRRLGNVHLRVIFSFFHRV